MTWRDVYRPMIAGVIDRVGRCNQEALRKALLAARPLEVLKCAWQAKIWRDEVAIQTGRKAVRVAKRRAAEKAAVDKRSGQRSFLTELDDGCRGGARGGR